ncbi:MAG: DUF4147 domain-containing protein [Minisyncoccia bacterium]
MKIQNFEQLAVSDARRALLTIADASLTAIDTTRVMREMLRVDGETLVAGSETIDLREIEHLVFIAVGKCAVETSLVAEEVLGDRIARGVVLDVKTRPASAPPSSRLKTFCGTHPLPSDENLRAAEAIVQTLARLTERDLVIFVISGGGSTLLFLPQDKTDRSEIDIFKALTNAGATIQEMNVVRKHLSLARGGYLAKYAYPARVISLVFSDVPGNDISSIASGPTIKDATTIEDAEKALAKFNVFKFAAKLTETPKEDKYFARVTNILAVSNVRALRAMCVAAEKLGFRAEIRGSELTGEASEAGRTIAETLHAAPAKSVLLWGGETTVTVRGTGSGGRNLELVASALRFIRAGEEILSLASDGRDHGPFAGAICDTITKKAIADAGVDPEQFLANNDTYGLFEKIGNYLTTGDTGSNVSDLVIALKT